MAMAVSEPGEGVIPVFSSLGEWGAFAGETDYFSSTGEDLLGLLLAGYDLVLDAAGDHPLRVDPAAFGLRGTQWRSPKSSPPHQTGATPHR